MGCGRCVVSCPTDALEFRDVRNEFMPNLRMNASHLLKRSEPATLAPRIEPAGRPATERRRDWGEDRRAPTLAEARAQASRCLDCGVPGCRDACPLHNRIPEWMAALAAGDVERAAAISHSTSNMPEICGALCPKERLCEGGCTLRPHGGAVTIGALEQFVQEEAWRRGWRPEPRSDAGSQGSAVVIGAGPAGLACADELAAAGLAVTVYDRNEAAGGLLSYGAPPFKLDRGAVDRLVARLEEAGVLFELGTDIDEARLLRLVEETDALFLGTGAQVARDIELPGRHLEGVVDGISWLAGVNAALLEERDPPDLKGQRVIVLGGGDTAMDCARSALRLGASSVTLAYRRGREMMRASPKEIEAADTEGVVFSFNRVPVAFEGDRRISSVRFASEEFDDLRVCDLVILAFGQAADRPVWMEPLGLATDEAGRILVDAQGRTANPKIFAGGDNANGPDLVVTAVAAGRKAGQQMAAAITASRGGNSSNR